MKICPNCGKETDSKFCPECGTDLTDVEVYKSTNCETEIEEGGDLTLNDANEVSDSVMNPESALQVESAEVISDTPLNRINNEANVSQNGKKPNKKTIGIIIGIIAVATILAIIGLAKPSGPKVDHYSINYYAPYDGESTAITDNIDLVAVYDNEEEVTIDKSEWHISKPALFSAPTTDITIRYNNEDLYFTISVNEEAPEPEPEPEPLQPDDMTVRDMMDSIESYLDNLISQSKCENYQESDNGKYIFITWPSGNKALISGVVFNKYENDKYVEVSSTDEIPDSMNVRTTEHMIQGETSSYVKGQSIYAMEYVLKAILPEDFGDDDELYDKLSEMHNEAGTQITGDGSYAISEKEINGYTVTLLLTQEDNKLDSVFSIKF